MKLQEPHLVECQDLQTLPLVTHIGHVVDVTKQFPLLLVKLLLVEHLLVHFLLVKLIRLTLVEAGQEGAGVGGGVDQGVDDVVARGGHHCQLHFALATDEGLIG